MALLGEGPQVSHIEVQTLRVPTGGFAGNAPLHPAVRASLERDRDSLAAARERAIERMPLAEMKLAEERAWLEKTAAILAAYEAELAR